MKSPGKEIHVERRERYKDGSLGFSVIKSLSRRGGVREKLSMG